MIRRLTNDAERAEWLQCLMAAASVVTRVAMSSVATQEEAREALVGETMAIAERFFRDYQERSK